MASGKIVFLVVGSWIILSVYFLKIYADLYAALEDARREAKRGILAGPITRVNSFHETLFAADMYLPKNALRDNSDFYYEENADSDDREDLSIPVEENPKYAALFEGGKLRSNITRVKVIVFSSDAHNFIHGITYITGCGSGFVQTEYADYNIDKVTSHYDVVVFAGEIMNDRIWDELVENRKSYQLWLLNTDANPLASMYFLPPKNMADSMFNLSFTYHSKAEISTPYGYYLPLKINTSSSLSFAAFHGSHKKTVAWDSGSCALASWDRRKFVNELSEFIQVDVYGDCGNLSCGSSRKRPSAQCNRIMRDYKFVLALEESCCSEYITRNFWNALFFGHNIPVVVGASKRDYENLAPLNSFIFAGDFNTTIELGAYLIKVASDPDLYNSFFAWRRHGDVKLTTKKQRQIKDNDALCRVFDYVKSSKNRTIDTIVDPYGPHWLGGCTRCYEHQIIGDRFLKGD